MTIVLLSGDLMVVARVSGAVAQKCQTLQMAASAEQAIDACREHAASLLVIDLSTPALDLDALVSEVKSGDSEPPRIIAFGPHVHEERLAAARVAGCDYVMSRGQFMGQLESLLQL